MKSIEIPGWLFKLFLCYKVFVDRLKNVFIFLKTEQKVKVYGSINVAGDVLRSGIFKKKQSPTFT